MTCKGCGEPIQPSRRGNLCRSCYSKAVPAPFRTKETPVESKEGA
jgi:NMD protein affecting ribosome stability and mRNA decay